MGQCCSANAAANTPISRLGPVLNPVEVSTVLSAAGVTANCQFKDSSYVTINLEDFVRFANIACNFGTKYKLEGNDCDDFAFIFLGRAREYYARAQSTSGVLFGYLDGDIRRKENDPTRGHAVCWFIDENKQLHIYDPMWNEIYPFEKFMTAWSVVV